MGGLGIGDLISSFHNNRHESVGLLDFFYYSICVSTTVSFGDIAPNNGWTRFLVIVELLVCVFVGHLVGWGVEEDL